MRYFRRIVLVLFILTCGAYFYYHTQVLSKIDHTPPVITAASDTIEVSIKASEEDLKAGITAEDETDGDVTDKLIVESTGKFSSPGKCEITYAAFDNAGNVSRYSRTLVYTDYTSPKLYLDQPLRINIDTYNYDILSRVRAVDCIDGDISGQLKFALAENLNYSQPGDYVVALQATNSYGDTAKLELQLELLSPEDFSEPYPILESYIAYVKKGGTLNLGKKQNVLGIQYGGGQYLFKTRDMTRYEVSQVKISGKVDYNEPGMYRVTYTLYTKNSDDEDEARGSCSLYVIVEE